MSNRTIKPDGELEGASYAKALESRNDPDYDKDVQKKLKAMATLEKGVAAAELHEDNPGEVAHIRLYFAVKTGRAARRAIMNAICKLCGIKTWTRVDTPMPGNAAELPQESWHSPPVHTFLQDQRPTFEKTAKTKRKTLKH